MKRALQIGVLVILAGAGYFAWRWLNPTPEEAIHRQMEKLAETLAVKPGEGNIARVASINRTLSFFTPDIQINSEGMSQFSESINGRTELQQALFAARQRLTGAITFHDVRVILGPEPTNAIVNLNAVAQLSGQDVPYSQNLRAFFREADGDWLIYRVEAIGLRPPENPEPEN